LALVSCRAPVNSTETCAPLLVEEKDDIQPLWIYAALGAGSVVLVMIGAYLSWKYVARLTST
jgi:hypothetical protein